MIRRMGLALAVLGVLSFASASRAATTVVTSGSWDGSDKTLDWVLGQAYGYTGPATGSVGGVLTWQSGGGNSINFTRIADDGGGTLMLSGPSGTVNDSVWGDGTPTFHVDVRYAANGQTLGWVNNVGSGSGDILTVTGSGLNPSFTYAIGAPPTALSSSFTWYDKTDAGTWSSNPVNNSNDGDHMVTFWVTGSYANGNLINGGLGAYVICFEDLPLAGSDRDYNDMVVEVSRAVPLPAAVWSGLAMLGGLGVFGAWRRKVRSALGTR
jgi:hypothetical protein